MSNPTLEQHVAELQREVAQLKAERANGQPAAKPAHGNWKSTMGRFDGDPVMKEIIDETLKVREEDRNTSPEQP